MKKQISAIYYFSRSYLHNFTQQEVTVKLEIDYVMKNFSITPANGTDNFKFIKSSQHYQMWLAVLSCISEAIEFANQELVLKQMDK